MSRVLSNRRRFWMPILFFILLIVGVIIGVQLNKYTGSKRPITTIIERNDRLEELINLINDRYVDSVSSDSLYKNAIKGILSHLDPHTVYIPVGKVAQEKAGLNGVYQGIGIELVNIKDTMRVLTVMANSPADEAGLQIGDGFIAIDSIMMVNKNLDIEDFKKIFTKKGKATVHLLISNIDNPQILKHITIKKGLVPLYSISTRYMISDKIGYIKLARFSAMTYREFKKALKTLKGQGMEKLILDLRGNPGGYVDAATAVADEFLSDDHLIVYTQGRDEPRKDYIADQPGLFEKGRLVILIDAGTASAAEILTGAVQDWDRGVVLGNRSFGKALVQQPYELGDGSILRLTIARYYTPSGRCIQRPYKKGRAVYRSAYINRLLHPDDTSFSPYHSDTSAQINNYFTLRSHRLLYGGGGILPDEIIPINHAFLEEDMLKIFSGNVVESVLLAYYIRHHNELIAFENPKGFVNHFKISNYLMNQLERKLNSVYYKSAYRLWKNPLALDYIRLQMKAELLKFRFGSIEYYEYLNQQDVVIKRAVNILNNSDYLKMISREAA